VYVGQCDVTFNSMHKRQKN